MIPRSMLNINLSVTRITGRELVSNPETGTSEYRDATETANIWVTLKRRQSIGQDEYEYRREGQSIEFATDKDDWTEKITSGDTVHYIGTDYAVVMVNVLRDQVEVRAEID